jgi:phosphoribosylaminoimidazole-succinocarboxamide synthase
MEVIGRLCIEIIRTGKEIAAPAGLILVDTKYEFGRSMIRSYLMDEIHTPDSSRYFYADGFEEDNKR